MGNNNPIREVMVTPEFKEQVEELRWARRSGLSALMRDAVEQFATNGIEGIKDTTDPGPGSEGLRFSLPLELWQSAEDKSWETRVKRPDGIRIVLQHMIAEAAKPARTRKAAAK